MERKSTTQVQGAQRSRDRVIGSKTTSTGREIWWLSRDGEPVTVVTSAASATAMNEALVKYGEALERLAKK